MEQLFKYGRVFRLFIPLLFLLMMLHSADAAAIRRTDKNFQHKKYSRHKIIVRQKRPKSKYVSVSLPPLNKVEPAAKKFFTALDKLPEEFIKRTGLKYVTFVTDLKVNKISAGGVAAGDTIVLNLSFSDKTVYHELFHIFDHNNDLRGWKKLNDDGFIYTGSDYYKERMSLGRKKRKEKNLASKRYNADFVSLYAMSNEREDRAETFAYMISEKKKFLDRTEKSEVLREKMKFIIDNTSKKKLLGKEFWLKNFEVNNLSELLK